MRSVRSALELRVELNCNEPGVNVLRKLNDFDKLTVGRETSELQTLCSELLTVGVVELVTMTVTLVDKTLAVKLAGDGIFVKLAGIQTQAHCTAHVNALLVGHDVDNVVLVLTELRGACALQTADISCELDNRHLLSMTSTAGTPQTRSASRMATL